MTDRPITGTHVYTMMKCPRAVALDLHEDRSRRRRLRDDEEFVLRRGREHEARVVAGLGWPEPEYDRGDFATGAAATAAMLADGIPGLSQGVLLGEGRLGIPDLLRRVPGVSRFGDGHYVVGDVKSSGRPRGDQILQVAFYSELLADLQGRAPAYAYLILKDGGEERFDPGEYGAVLSEVLERIREVRADPARATPFAARACSRCHWSDLCMPLLEERDDLSLVQGMTRGLRTTLEASGVRTCADLRAVSAERVARRTHLEPALLRRLKRAADARAAARPLAEPQRAPASPDPAVYVHFLTDPFEDRVLYMGLLDAAAGEGGYHDACPTERAQEWSAFGSLIGRVHRGSRLAHYGRAVPRWYEEHAHGRTGSMAVESRFVDLARQLRGAAVYPASVFGLADHVRCALDRDPHRFGRAAAAALRAAGEGGTDWLRAKGRGDLRDLADLERALLGDGPSERRD